ncbi:MAG: FliA/WhiG family RNA polymerase sigma factor [Caldithrix sp.]|nr:FliA/WhiG family RNA polymerase sigma factor [Caldithrix sp.]
MQGTATIANTFDSHYFTGHDYDYRQELMVKYLGLVKYVVRKMIKSFPKAIEEEDLYQIGILGLSEAIERFDPDFGIKFETYAIPRIKGCIIDELRKLDWIPRSLRTKINHLKDKTSQLEQKFSDQLTDHEVAASLGIKDEDLNNWKREMNAINLQSLDKPIDEQKRQTLYDVIEDRDYVQPDGKIEDEEMKHLLLKYIKKLPEKTRLVITLYYYEKLTFREIGTILNVSESRISQIHSETLAKLRKELIKANTV